MKQGWDSTSVKAAERCCARRMGSLRRSVPQPRCWRRAAGLTQTSWSVLPLYWFRRWWAQNLRKVSKFSSRTGVSYFGNWDVSNWLWKAVASLLLLLASAPLSVCPVGKAAALVLGGLAGVCGSVLCCSGGAERYRKARESISLRRAVCQGCAVNKIWNHTLREISNGVLSNL